MTEPLPELLDARHLQAELGVTRAAAEAIMRRLPVVQVPGLRKTYVQPLRRRRLPRGAHLHQGAGAGVKGPGTEENCYRSPRKRPARCVSSQALPTPLQGGDEWQAPSSSPKTTSGGRRFAVRYRLGGRAWPIQHGGSFPTMREARARRDLIAGELAAGRNPRDVLSRLGDAPPTRTLSDWWPTWLDSRIDVDERTRANYGYHWKRLEPAFGHVAPEAIEHGAIQAWVNEQTEHLTPAVVREYLGTLRQLLDFVGLERNPARHHSVRLPRGEREVPMPPSDGHVLAILEHMPQERRLAFVFMEQTGARLGEHVQWTWGDVDIELLAHPLAPRDREGQTGQSKAALGAGACLAHAAPPRSGAP